MAEGDRAKDKRSRIEGLGSRVWGWWGTGNLGQFWGLGRGPWG